ncbi:SCO3242 family prenyltransferase [Streptomyces physcomitrii]|uniref:UbiA family prenyltransferase n=1 Tax=Streptomyces physcomitrii TaxID=2724184 RepID=A0ABX1H2P0_9ACTN|nr:UbiA family prenyltransferase [Streptomyces physcomitrii]NKI42632.1 UbiA family prenyltransferase [Streptomyces physcomitrii]
MSTPRDWAELLRVSALLSVPGDALAGAAASRRRPNSRTALALCSSLCLYEAGMALNDWADHAEDAEERPHRPLPSGRIAPGAALAAAAGLTAAGLGLAARAGRPAALCATALAGAVWAYDLRLKHTAAGPAAMAAARGLDLVLGALATAGPRSGEAAGSVLGRALPPAAVLGAHTWAVTAVSRAETQGGSAARPLAALGTTAALGTLLAPAGARPLRLERARRLPETPRELAQAALAGAYAATAGRPYLHAALNPSPPLTQRAVGGGIRAMIPLQAALAARSGALATAASLGALVPLARSLARKVSPT